MSRNVRWVVLMTIGGLATMTIVWVLTNSLGWGLVALLASGVVFNVLFGGHSHRGSDDRRRDPA
jgi:hypothetical protein